MTLLEKLAQGRRDAVIVRETQAKAILSVSKIYDYALNPYTGCEHACSYCYARFMKRFTGHKEPWGEFVDAKMNAPDLLAIEIGRKTRGTVWVSGVCDPYQPLEAPVSTDPGVSGDPGPAPVAGAGADPFSARGTRHGHS